MREPRTPLLVLFALCAFAVILFSPTGAKNTDPSATTSGVRGGGSSTPDSPDGVVSGGGGGDGGDGVPAVVEPSEPTTSAGGATAPGVDPPTTDTPGTATPPAGPSEPSCLFPSSLLVIGFGRKVSREDVLNYVQLYKPFFSLIVVTGEVHDVHPAPAGVNIHECNSNRGAYLYACTAVAMQEYPKFDSYMYVDSHTLVFPWEMAKLDQSKVWTPQWEAHDIPDAPGQTSLSYELLDTKKCKVRHNIAVPVHMEGRLVGWAGNPSFVFLPSAFVDQFVHFARAFKTCRTSGRLGFPNAVHHALALAHQPPFVVDGLLLPSGSSADPDHWYTHYKDDAKWVEGVGFGGDSWEHVISIFSRHHASHVCSYNPYAGLRE